MSKTEMSRPYPIFFSDYTRDEMSMILAKTAISFNQVTSSSSASSQAQSSQRHAENIKFYSRIILEVFYPICKDLNEIQYLIQIYYDQLLSAAAESGGNDQMMAAWNRMKPFLKQALTQIYLRQSMHNQNKSLTSEEVRFFSLI
jgi:arginine/lysine/ornithine decarboxylase